MSKMLAKDITNKNMTACLSILMMCIFVLSACNVNNKKGVKIKGSDSCRVLFQKLKMMKNTRHLF